MKELKDIVSAYEEAVKHGVRTALATVVEVEGSAYRRPGARMLITEDGKLTGAISGGCLEGDALRKAQHAIRQNKIILATYDTTDDDDVFGVGLGCNGIISILIEPIDHNSPVNPIELFKCFFQHQKAAVLTTIFNVDKKQFQTGTRILIFPDGVYKGDGKKLLAMPELVYDASEALESMKSCIKILSADERILFQVLSLTVTLHIYGAGNDSIPLSIIAHQLGWDSIIIDGRPQYATTSRFPFAKKIIIAKADQGSHTELCDGSSVAVLMTHNYNYDLSILSLLLPLQLPYIGILGPKKKLNKMLEELHASGVSIPFSFPGNVYGPAGLDIGAETPEEIALSILSEIKAVLNHREAPFLRDKTTSIHALN